MDFKLILEGIAVLGAMGAIFGALLAFAAKIFYVEVDPKQEAVRACLAGANCGGCGYPGCDGYAAAVAAGKAPVNCCVAGGQAAADQIAEIMGVSAGAEEKMVAFVPCSGAEGVAVKRFNYSGPQDCQAAMLFGGKSNKECRFACIGLGNCARACKFGAMHIVNGVAKNTFAPDDSITREQIAAMLYRYAGAEAAKEDKLSAFPDAAKVSDWAKEALNWAVAGGLINGVADANGTANLEPQATATRAQIATILMRWLEK